MKFILMFLTAFCLTVDAAVILGLLYGSLNAFIAWLSFAIGIMGSLVVLSYPLPKAYTEMKQKKTFTFWEWVTFVTYGVFVFRAFLWIVFWEGDSLKGFLMHNFGDISLHIAYINHMASGATFWPQEPIFSGLPLNYTLGADLFNSLLILVGVDLVKSLVWVGLLSGIATGIALYYWGGAFTLAGFLFNGGLAGFMFFKTWTFADYQADLVWKSIPLTLYLTQRGFLFAIPATLILLYNWRLRFLYPQKKRYLPLWIETLFFISLPLFSIHTFLFLLLLLPCWLLFYPSLRKSLYQLAFASFVPLTLILYQLTNHFQKASILHIQWGWEFDFQHPLYYVFENWGPFIIYLVALISVLLFPRFLKQSSSRWVEVGRAFIFPTLFITGICHIVMFAPWSWDNIKMILWSYLIILPFIWHCYLENWPFWARAISCFLLFFSGFITLWGGLGYQNIPYEIGKRSEMDNISKALQNISPNSTYASAPIVNHPLLLIGKKVTLGYPAHAWAHGIDVEERNEAVTHLLNGDKGWEKIAQDLHVDFIFWGKSEEITFPKSAKPWQTQKPIQEGTWGKIYKANIK